MARNKNALLRYRTIDRCLRNTSRRWTLADLVDACSDALYEYEGKPDLVSTRTVQLDLQIMRSDRLGYEAPIEVYDRKYYRYADPDYSINNRPLSQHDIDLLSRTIDLLRQFDEFDTYHEMADVVNRLQDKVASAGSRRPIVDFERNPNLRGLRHLTPLYDIIASRTTVGIDYRPFGSDTTRTFILYPHLLKEYRNRWFLFGTRTSDMRIFNLALDRIESFHTLPDIPYRDNPRFGPDYFDDMVGVTKDTRMRPRRIVVKAFAAQAGYIITKPIHASQRLVDTDPADGSMTFELQAVINYELIALLLTYGADIRVLHPPSLAATMRDTLLAAAARYTP
ncbi:MAG: WYL domain-containing protein [Muribaculaceae bacterium]|jgi:predicted DNA-binding transcriptional regulator YafY|nr:WYL domain-containing protein [Muribaculaceae bacterium]